MLSRIRGVFALSAATFRDVENDTSANIQALIIVIVSSIVAGLSGGTGEVLFGIGVGRDETTTYRILAIAGWAIVAWVLWSVLTLLIGTRIYNGDANLGEMLRVIGFAYAPLVISVFRFIPVIGFLFNWLAIFWAIAAVYSGVKEGLDLETGETMITMGAGAVLYLIGMGVILAIV